MFSISTAEGSRKRTINFSSKEVDILINLVAKYKDIIECKKTDRTSNTSKNEAWIQLSKEFNSISGEAYRDPKILKNKYENIKKRSKQKFADEKMYRQGTGGGPEKSSTLTDVDEKLKSIIGSQITGLQSEFDGDQENCDPVFEIEPADFIVEVSQLDTVSETPQKIALHESDLEEEEALDASPSCSNKSAAMNWSKYIPSQLRTPKSLPLKTKIYKKSNKENIGRLSSQAQLSSKVITWASNKAEIESDRHKFLQEEHQLKLQCMKEKHELEMNLMKKESEQRCQSFAKQADLQLQILNLQKQQYQ